MKAADDAARAYLRDRGCGQRVVEGGLEGLVVKWAKFAAGIGQDSPGGLDAYLNDLDVRQILADVLSVITADEARAVQPRIDAADSAFRAVTKPGTKCLWGTRNATTHHYTAARNWWYFAVPRLCSAEFRAELQGLC